MGKSKTLERTQSQELFVNTNLTLKEIAAMVNVSAAKVGQWSKEDKWELQRTAKQNTAEKIISGWYGQLQLLNEQIENNGGIPSSADSDKISKITDSIQKLSKKQNLSMYHLVLKEFLLELQQSTPDAAKILAPLMLDFLKQKAQHLSNDK